MPLFKIYQHFEDSKSMSFEAPFDSEADAIAAMTPVLGSQFEVLTPVSVAGNKADATYTKVLITLKSLVDGKVAQKAYINALVKPTVSESDIQAALVGKTYANGVDTFLVDEVAVSETKAVA